MNLVISAFYVLQTLNCLCPIHYMFNKNLCYPKEFIPSLEYQVIEEGQILPKGLEIKIDLSTGLKLARLISYTPKNELILKDTIHDEIHPVPKVVKAAQKQSKKMQILNLINKSINNKDLNKALEILDDLETRVHEEEIGEYFATHFLELGLINNKIMEKDSQNYNNKIAEKILLVAGSSVQNSLKNQLILSKKEIVEKVLQILKSSDVQMCLITLYFLGALLRNNYVGIEHFHSINGSDKLLTYYKNTKSPKAVRKILDIISDTHNPEMIDNTKFNMLTQSQLKHNEIYKWCNTITNDIQKTNDMSPQSISLKEKYSQCLNVLFKNFEHNCVLDSGFIEFVEDEKLKYSKNTPMNEYISQLRNLHN